MNNLKAKVIRGSINYFFRQLAVAATIFTSNIIILRWLSPQDIGCFAAITIVLVLTQIFADGGLSIYLVQRNDNITDIELSGVATLQLFMYGIIHFIMFVVLIYQHITSSISLLLIYLFVLLFSIPIVIFRANSFVKLERDLLFGKIAIIEVVESLVYALTSLLLAFFQMGVWSLILAQVVKSIIGYFISLRYSQWKFNFKLPSYSKELKNAIYFGVNYHIPAVITQLRISINPIVIGGLLGMAAVGVADRAIYFSGLPLFFLGAVQHRVLFPYFSRIQNDFKLVRSNFEKSLYISAIVDKILYIPIVLFAKELVNIYLPNWYEIIPLLYIIILGNIIFGALHFSSFPVLNGIGKSSSIAKLSALTLILTWIFIWPLIEIYGLIGFAYLMVLLWIAGAVPEILILRKCLPDVKVFRQLMIPLIAFIISTAIIFGITFAIEDIKFSQIILYSISGICMYLILLAFLDGRYIYGMIKQMRFAYINS